MSGLDARVWVQLSRSSELLLKDLLSGPYLPVSVCKVCSKKYAFIQALGKKCAGNYATKHCTAKICCIKCTATIQCKGAEASRRRGQEKHQQGLPSGIFSSSSARQCHLFIIIQAWHGVSSCHHHLCHVCHPCQGLPSSPRHPGTKEDLGGRSLYGRGR